MSAPSDPTSQPSMFSAEDFPVSPTRWLADVPAPATSATSGPTLSDSFARLNPDGSWRKTCQGYSQVTLDGSLETFSETWPRAGMTRNGIAYQQVPLAPLTDATESGLWVGTPTQCDAEGTVGRSKRFQSKTPRPTELARMWPTPTARDFRSQHSPDSASFLARQDNPRGVNLVEELQRREIHGQLNPTWVEWLMGYPLGWTVCAAWATASSRRSRNGSRNASKTRS